MLTLDDLFNILEERLEDAYQQIIVLSEHDADEFNDVIECLLETRISDGLLNKDGEKIVEELRSALFIDRTAGIDIAEFEPICDCIAARCDDDLLDAIHELQSRGSSLYTEYEAIDEVRGRFIEQAGKNCRDMIPYIDFGKLAEDELSTYTMYEINGVTYYAI